MSKDDFQYNRWREIYPIFKAIKSREVQRSGRGYQSRKLEAPLYHHKSAGLFFSSFYLMMRPLDIAVHYAFFQCFLKYAFVTLISSIFDHFNFYLSCRKCQNETVLLFQ